MKTILQHLFDHHTLNRNQAKEILTNIAQNKYNDSEVISFISVFLMRSITLNELEGFQEALLELAVPIDLETHDLVDIVGTGGDCKNTFNISTLASLVVAGSGQKVAKHGNYGVSSVSGASNVLEVLGYQFKSNSEELKKDLDTANFCFIHAPLFHPALKNVAGLRKDLGLRTFFNMLGPLVNPAKPEYSLIGVYNPEIARIYQYLLQKQKDHFCLVHGLDGYDEISLTGDTKIYSEDGERIFSAEELHFKTLNPESIFGGNSTRETADKFERILQGNGTYAENAVVIANAAMAITMTKKFGTYEDCLQLATDSLQNGKAYECFLKLINKN